MKGDKDRASTMMNGAIHEISRNWRIILIAGITLVSVLLAISLLLLFFSRKNLGRVRSMNFKYAQSQSALHNVSLIKDRMLGNTWSSRRTIYIRWMKANPEDFEKEVGSLENL